MYQAEDKNPHTYIKKSGILGITQQQPHFGQVLASPSEAIRITGENTYPQSGHDKPLFHKDMILFPKLTIILFAELNCLENIVHLAVYPVHIRYEKLPKWYDKST